VCYPILISITGYTWSFEPKTDWSANYASASEIRQYFVDFCARYDLQKYIRLEHQVLSAEWSQDDAQWNIAVQNLQNNTQVQTTAQVLINATGVLNNWTWPQIDGLHSFKGKLLHSAAWEENVDLENKVVGLIGNG
jgi:cation diffusion facilitator CzcD-associated flavoprotein CzcO